MYNFALMTVAHSLFRKRVALAAVVLSSALLTAPAQAVLTIEIIGGGAQQIPVTILPLLGEDRFTDKISQIVSADLQRSGQFKLGSVGSVRPFPSDPSEVNYRYWKSENAQSLVVGRVLPRNDGRVDVQFRMMDIARQSQMMGFSFVVAPLMLRNIAHRIADLIYEKLTGDAGVFATKICYVIKGKERWELQVADADGAGSEFILAYNQPIISPAWSPDGTRIAYVSFEKKKATVFVHSLLEGKRQVLADFSGSNSGPTWSPDGKRLAVVLTRDGTSQIYLVSADGAGFSRVAESPSIDTEPSFSPDGKFLLFMSDRGGSPQIYRLRIDGGEVERMTFEGNYNATPRYSPDGKSFVFIHRNNGRFNIALQDFATRQMRLLTDGVNDQSPTFAPNGKMVLYASEINGRGILAAVSSDGRIKQRITAPEGAVIEPAWGPLSMNRRKESDQ
jgi:TolB protein